MHLFIFCLNDNGKILIMIKKAAQIILSQKHMHGQLIKYFGGHGPTPQKLQKVVDTTIKFNVKNIEGQWEQIHAVEGQSFYQAIRRMNVRGMERPELCNGGDMTYRPHERPHDPFSTGPCCGECRIVLKDNWYNKIYEETDGITKQQQVLLLKFSNVQDKARLACCIPVEKWMEGCTFEVLPKPEISEMTKLI